MQRQVVNPIPFEVEPHFELECADYAFRIGAKDDCRSLRTTALASKGTPPNLP